MGKKMIKKMLACLCCSLMAISACVADERVELDALALDLSLPENWFHVPAEDAKGLVPDGTELFLSLIHI